MKWCSNWLSNGTKCIGGAPGEGSELPPSEDGSILSLHSFASEDVLKLCGSLGGEADCRVSPELPDRRLNLAACQGVRETGGSDDGKLRISLMLQHASEGADVLIETCSFKGNVSS